MAAQRRYPELWRVGIVLRARQPGPRNGRARERVGVLRGADVSLSTGQGPGLGPVKEAYVAAKPVVFEFGMGVDVHGEDATRAACRAVSDAIRHSSLPLFRDVRGKGGRILVDVT